jgi:surface protein
MKKLILFCTLLAMYSSVHAQTFIADDKGIIKCSGAVPGDKGVINGVTFEAVDRALLIQRRDDGADLTKVCTSLVTDMSTIFYEKDFNQPIGNWDVSNVTNMSMMFYKSTFNQPIGNWDVGKLVDMHYMFGRSRFNQPIGNWNVSNVEIMSGVFEVSAFNQPLNDWDVSKVTITAYMFLATSFNQPLDKWNVSKVTSMGGMFRLGQFNQPIGSWNVSSVTDMNEMFKNSRFNQAIGNWDVRSISNMDNMFENSLFNQDLSGWCVGHLSIAPTNFSNNTPNWTQPKPVWGTCPLVTNPSSSFIVDEKGIVKCTGVNPGDKGFIDEVLFEAVDRNLLIQRRDEGADLSNVCTSLVTDMGRMFEDKPDFNQPIGNWDVSNVESMYHMFVRARSFNQPIGNWDVSSVTSMGYMFHEANAFNQPIGDWDVSSLTGHHSLSGTFEYARSFNQDLSRWDVSKIQSMRHAFNGAISFNEPLNTWNVEMVEDMNAMFLGATSFNQDLSMWDVSKVVSMKDMFHNASSFNQSLGEWDYRNITTDGLQNFINNSGISAYQYDLLLKSWASNESFPSGLTLDMQGLSYCDDKIRQDLISQKNLTISGDSQLDGCEQSGDYTSGMVAFYPFNGDASDATGNGWNGMVNHATPTKDRFGMNNSAFAFDEGQEIIIPGSENQHLYPLTVSLWVNVGELKGQGGGKIFGKYVPGAWNGYNMFAQTYEMDGTTYTRIVPWYIRNFNDRILGQYGEPNFETHVETNQWNHIVFSVDQYGGRIYLNGEFADYHPWTGVPGPTSSGYQWQIGGAYDEMFIGKLDDLRIYNRSLLPSEITELYKFESETLSSPVFGNVFNSSLQITNGKGESLNLNFGVAEDATEEYDSNFDQYAPPVPPNGLLDARFIHLTEEYYTDIRPLTETQTVWNLKLNSGGSLPLRLAWDPGTLPSEGLITVKDVIGGTFVNIDMRLKSELEINESFVNHLIITHKVNQEAQIIYRDKWNLVSLPIRLNANSFTEIFSDAIPRTLFGFDSNYVLQETLEPGKGYWIRMNQAGSTTLRGAPIESLNLELQSGWNLISGPSESVAVSSIEDSDDIIIPGSIFGFNGSYVNATTIEPGRGYWVRTNQAGSVTLRGGAASKTVQSHPSLALSGFDRIEFLSVSEEKPISTLYLNGSIRSPYSAINFELPPVPPAGNVDVRWEDGSYVSESSKATVLIQQGTSPIQVLIPSTSPDIETGTHAGTVLIREFIGDRLLAEAHIQRQEHYTLSSQTNRIEFELQEKADLPAEFTLDQNYPNPFNPTTTIRFGLPESADVSLEVYTVLGQKVMTLVNENRSAGWHTVSFNGARLSSGVYVYRIQAGGMVQTRKLMLVK